MAAVVRTQEAAALWHQPVHPLVLAVEVDKDRVRDETITRNKAVIAFFSTKFMHSFFAKMLFHMRIALGMATHTRLGNNANCRIGQLDSDVMNIIFAQLFDNIGDAHDEFQHMLR